MRMIDVSTDISERGKAATKRKVGRSVPQSGTKPCQVAARRDGLALPGNRRSSRRFSQILIERTTRAFTMVEVLVSVAIAGIMFISLYTSFSAGFAVVELARENLRATQILQEKMETIRLYTWAQINTSGFIPTNFTDVLYAASNITSGLTYTGTVSIAESGISEAYSNDLKLITIKVNWTSAKVNRKREMSTFVSQYGLQNYIY